MWSFKRKPKQTPASPVSEETKAYYQSESKDNRARVWVLSILTFILTLVIILGLFWAGRGLYRYFNKPDALTPSSSQQNKAPSKENLDSKKPDSGSNKDTSATTGTQPSAPQPTTPAPTTSPTPSPSSSTPLIDTGPGDVDL